MRICRFTALIFILLIGGLFSLPVRAEVPFQTVAEQAVMIDYDTGMVLFEKNADERMPTSSMSKVMTMYMIFEALEQGRLSLDTTLPVSEKAWRMGGSKMFVEVGDQAKVEDLIRGVVVQSGNDATIVLAEGLAGTEAAFAAAMNRKAADLGMTDSHFVNASGWPDPEHYSTARDLAKLGIATIRNFPEYYPYYSELEFTYSNIKQGNRNPLLYRNIGADGIKTGHTEAAGYGLMASGTLNGRRVVMVLNGMSSAQERADEGARLLEWGLKGFENVNLFTSGETAGQARVVLGTKAQVPLTIAEDLTVTLPLAVRNALKVEAVYEEPLKAPVSKGARIGTLRVEIPRMDDIEVPLVAAEDISRSGFLAETWAKAKLFLAGGDAGS